jgi:aspartate racemase
MDYYKFINEGVNEKLGGLNYAECIIYSLNFGDVQAHTWENSFGLLLNACESLKRSGAESLVLCANTAHLFADRLQQETGLPVIHIATATAVAIRKKGLKKVGLLGTKFTMEMDFYRSKLEEHGLTVMVPAEKETREYVQHIVKEELGRGIVSQDAKEKFISIAEELIKNGAEGIVLGCTEIPMLIGENDFAVPVFDTTKIHSAAVVDFMLAEN